MVMLVIGAALMADSSRAQEVETLAVGAAEIQSEVMAEGLDAGTDFSVSPDGETVFWVEMDGKQIRRLHGDSNEVVIEAIEAPDQNASSISVSAINSNRVMVGVAGFTSPKLAVSLFDLSSAKEFPLDFMENMLPLSRAYERWLKHVDPFDVIKFFQQQRCISMVRRVGAEALTICDIHLKDGGLGQLVDDRYVAELAEVSDLRTLTVDPLGGYFVSLSREQGGTTELMFARAEGVPIQSFAIGIAPVVSVGFTPKYRRLYALVASEGAGRTQSAEDVAEIVTSGIYEIYMGDQGCSTKKVLALPEPQMMKIDHKGRAWVICKSNRATDGFQLVKISGLDRARVGENKNNNKEESSSEN